MTRTGPLALPGAAPRPRSERSGRGSVGRRAPARLRVRGAAGRGDRPRLQHPHVPVGIECPLGVLRRPVVALDPYGEIRELTHLRVIEHRAHRLLRRELAHGSSRHPRPARSSSSLARTSRVTIAIVCFSTTYRSGETLPETTASPSPNEPSITIQSARPVDGSIVNITPGARGGDLTLDHHRDVHLRLGEATLGAVEHRATAKQRGPAATHRIDQRVAAAHVEKRLVHPGERRGLGVLRRRGGADRNGRRRDRRRSGRHTPRGSRPRASQEEAPRRIISRTRV